jgi:hypothetical protein
MQRPQAVTLPCCMFCVPQACAAPGLLGLVHMERGDTDPAAEPCMCWDLYYGGEFCTYLKGSQHIVSPACKSQSNS